MRVTAVFADRSAVVRRGDELVHPPVIDVVGRRNPSP
jgi:hypothetical protein